MRSVIKRLTGVGIHRLDNVLTNLNANGFNKSFTRSVKININISLTVQSYEYLLKITNIKNNNNFTFRYVTVEEVLSIIKSLKSFLCLDVYALNTLIIKDASRDICEVLRTLLNKCIIEVNFPAVYKHVKVVPIHQFDQQTYNNYRPITTVPVISKILKKTYV